MITGENTPETRYFSQILTATGQCFVFLHEMTNWWLRFTFSTKRPVVLPNVRVSFKHLSRSWPVYRLHLYGVNQLNFDEENEKIRVENWEEEINWGRSTMLWRQREIYYVVTSQRRHDVTSYKVCSSVLRLLIGIRLHFISETNESITRKSVWTVVIQSEKNGPRKHAKLTEKKGIKFMAWVDILCKALRMCEDTER